MSVDSSESGLANSFTDLMTSLAVIFILLLVASLNNAQQEGEMTRNAILLRLRETLDKELIDYKDKGFEVKNDPKDPLGLIVVVPDGLLNFEVNKSNIPSAGIQFLQTILPKMANTICNQDFRKEINSIVVEGHTDSTGRDELNLPLSQARSMAVVYESLKVLSDNENIEKSPAHRACFLELLSATGRGSVEPILDNKGGEDLSRSRRVIFKIRVRSLEQRMIKAITNTASTIENTGTL
jgi:outer membrane protein OmpA-like peptidoglycan-associated protein